MWSILSLFQLVWIILDSGTLVAAQDDRVTCTVIPKGKNVDDVPQLLDAFKKCGKHGRIIFPQGQTYWIATKINPQLSDVDIEWRGRWLFSDDLKAWRNNSYHIEFQNHWAGFALSGDNIRINGFNTGGINGNGDAWYTYENHKFHAVQPGRPMPFVLWNVTDVSVQHFYIRQPQLWSINIMNGKNIYFNDIYVNATSSKAPKGHNWVQNTDGLDTMDVNNFTLENFVYQGGDDCLALKARSYNVFARNLTCYGGNGVAIGSLGQYPEDSSVENVSASLLGVTLGANISKVTITNVAVHRTFDLNNGAYIKTWIGQPAKQKAYESAGKPNGGGTGVVKNITFSNFALDGPVYAIMISQDYGNNGTLSGTSKMSVSDITFSNFHGHTLSANKSAVFISCSRANPCADINLEDINVFEGKEATEPVTTAKCKFTPPESVIGLPCANATSEPPSSLGRIGH